MSVQHEFTARIFALLQAAFGEDASAVFQNSVLLQYINIKTRSASRGSKARSSFANLYALYVLVEDYVKGGFAQNNTYAQYTGANFTDLLRRQRELPFGSKLQNHALNARLNDEFYKYFPTSERLPIIRDVQTAKYWINEYLLVVELHEQQINIAETVLTIIEAYIQSKQTAFEQFVSELEQIQDLRTIDASKAKEYMYALLKPNVDARIFEIVSFAILKQFYADRILYWGWNRLELREESLMLYKTGRTNANDGGIDFVMRPLGRFFQVTETLDVRKYLLDIDKIQRFPLTFVVKSEKTIEDIQQRLREQAKQLYPVEVIVERYRAAIEEIINIPRLLQCFEEVVAREKLSAVIAEIILQSRLEFNIAFDVT